MSRPHRSFFSRCWQGLFGARESLPPELAEARALIAAIDAGGVPLNPAKINHIARNLGLEVSNRAPQEETIERIRMALKRVHSCGNTGSENSTKSQ